MKADKIIFLLIVVLSAGCSHSQVWVKSGGNQQTFNLDSRECDIIAQQISLQQSETGKTIDPVNYNKAYIECLGAKGWRPKINATEITKEDIVKPAQALAEVINPLSVRGFGQTVIVPESFNFVISKQFQIGPTVIQQFFWKGENSTFINILFQKNYEAPFEQLSYPVSEPYKIYTFGKGESAKEKLQWSTFFGFIDPDWIMGTGAYYYAGKNERIIVVITKTLSKPTSSSPQNIILTRNQFSEIDRFSDQWLIWLNQQFQEGPGILIKLKNLFRFGI